MLWVAKLRCLLAEGKGSSNASVAVGAGVTVINVR